MHIVVLGRPTGLSTVGHNYLYRGKFSVPFINNTVQVKGHLNESRRLPETYFGNYLLTVLCWTKNYSRRQACSVSTDDCFHFFISGPFVARKHRRHSLGLLAGETVVRSRLVLSSSSMKVH